MNTSSQPVPSVQAVNAAQRINQDSGTVEYYTPAFIINRARQVMGHIDLDPASSEKANLTVQARGFFTAADDGLSQRWFGSVWMNHPFSRAQNKQWIEKLIAEYTSGNVTQACCITFASTSESWFAPLYSYPMCFLSPRTNYLLPNGQLKKGVTKGSVVTYLGHRIAEFIEHFQPVGHIMLPANRSSSRGQIQPTLFGAAAISID